MSKKILILILLIPLSNCSIDNKTGIWKEKNKTLINTKLTDLKFEYETSFKEFKENAIKYGKLSEYPILDE